MKKLFLVTSLVFSLFTAPAVLAEMVNINKADAATLQANLKGVGEKKAGAIVTYRTEHGEFKALEELMEVPGIGEGIFKKVEADISLSEGATSMPEKAAEADSKKAGDSDKGAAGATGEQGTKADTTQKSDKASDKSAAKVGKP